MFQKKMSRRVRQEKNEGREDGKQEQKTRHIQPTISRLSMEPRKVHSMEKARALGQEVGAPQG